MNEKEEYYFKEMLYCLKDISANVREIKFMLENKGMGRINIIPCNDEQTTKNATGTESIEYDANE